MCKIREVIAGFFFEMKWSNALKGKFLIFVFSDTYGPASFLQNGRLCLQAQVLARHHSISKISVYKKMYFLICTPRWKPYNWLVVYYFGWKIAVTCKVLWQMFSVVGPNAESFLSGIFCPY